MTLPRQDTILVTGGAGFIGSHVVERLVRSGWRVVNLDRLTYAGNLQNLVSVSGCPKHVFIKGDIADRKLVSELFAEYRPRVVFNLAAESHVDRSIEDAQDFIQTNVDGVFRLLECSLSYYRSLEEASATHSVSSRCRPTKSTAARSRMVASMKPWRYQPNSPYAATKAAGDHLVRTYGVTFGTADHYCAPPAPMGRVQYPEKLIPHMILSAIAGKPLPVYGRGDNVRDWM